MNFDLEKMAMAILVKFVQFGPVPTDGELNWASANRQQNTEQWQRALLYARAVRDSMA